MAKIKLKQETFGAAQAEHLAGSLADALAG